MSLDFRITQIVRPHQLLGTGAASVLGILGAEVWPRARNSPAYADSATRTLLVTKRPP